MKLYQAIAQKLEQGGTSSSLAELIAYLPEGHGFDDGTQLDLSRSTPDKLVLKTSFYHYDDNAYFLGRTDHTVIVRPSFTREFTITVTGRDKDGIKDHIAAEFRRALKERVTR